MKSFNIDLQATLADDNQGLRLDQALAKCFTEHSRTRLSTWIKEGVVTVNGVICTEPKFKMSGGEVITICANLVPQQEDAAQELALDIIYEDAHLLVVNKPAGLVVHPAAGNRQGTLMNALLYHSPQLRHLPRAGIVHRLDKNTTGLMVVAKDLTSHTALVAALQARTIERRYLALVTGEIIAGSTIETYLGRHPYHRTKMAVVAFGKPAITHYRCKKRYQGFTLLNVKLETGRTHQIRVHLSHVGHPIVGDSTYGWRLRLPAKSTPELQNALTDLKRQALHARKLSFAHPQTGQMMTFKADLPEDFTHLLTLLQVKEEYNA